MWRWTGFNMGLDLIITFDHGTLSMKRNLVPILGTDSRLIGGNNGNEHEAVLSNHRRRHIYFRVSAASLNEQKQVVYKVSSGIQSVALGRNASHPLLKVDMSKATFPLLLSFNFASSSTVSIGGPASGDDDGGNDLVELDRQQIPQPGQDLGGNGLVDVDNNGNVVELPA